MNTLTRTMWDCYYSPDQAGLQEAMLAVAQRLWHLESLLARVTTLTQAQDV